MNTILYALKNYDFKSLDKDLIYVMYLRTKYPDVSIKSIRSYSNSALIVSKIKSCFRRLRYLENLIIKKS